uniref:Uncharacterized protein n=1 Tax=Magnetococcus massalia (strain MO-1) TaxID=451514 RepID=A0A1S7LI87_MAGMO|nr:Conserved protein of unknown function [Candidatus Magnetococcus massalia]
MKREEKQFKSRINKLLDGFEHRHKMDGVRYTDLESLQERILLWKKKVESISHTCYLMAESVEKRGYPCTAYHHPTFHPDTRQTYSNQITIQTARVKLDNYPRFQREVIREKALEKGDRLVIEEAIEEGMVWVHTWLDDEAQEPVQYPLEKLSVKLIEKILEEFLTQVFD